MILIRINILKKNNEVLFKNKDLSISFIFLKINSDDRKLIFTKPIMKKKKVNITFENNIQYEVQLSPNLIKYNVEIKNGKKIIKFKLIEFKNS